MEIKKNFYEIISERIINLLSSAGEYQKKWIDTQNGIAFNPYTKTIYDGINQILLHSYILEGDYKINKWLTFKQASELGGRIIKGSHAYSIVYYNYTYTYKKTGDKIKQNIYNLLSSEEKKQVSVNSFLNFYAVFNVAQIEDLPAVFYTIDDIPVKSFTPIADLENLANNYINNSGITFKEIPQNKAFYTPSTDCVTMPLKSQFFTETAYYKTLFHELGHTTGHSSRLDRGNDTRERDGSEEDLKLYALEELVAELNTVFINLHFGVETEISNNVAYIKTWLNYLKNDTKFFTKATALATRSARFMLDYINVKELAA